MAEEQVDYITPLLTEFNTKIQDLEEKQRLMKERLLLIGENLVETKQDIEIKFAKISSSLDTIKDEVIKIKDTTSIITDDLDSFARKKEVELLKKQATMFDPLNLARIKDVKQMIKEAKQ
ncbi:MAG: hypothetical protein KKF56_00790 [Nanoarchaeota archaeon]|nr:hypothetical protein [Nanoarchaeota archaeon]